MAALCRIFVILTTWVTIVNGDYTYWSPDGAKDLWCLDNDECVMRSTSKMDTDHCCACNAMPQWELPLSNLSYQSLAIELLDAQDKQSKVFSRSTYSPNSTVFSFTYTYGKLRQFPDNACTFDIVFIDVTNNQFTEIGNISCFIKLDTLIMKSNKITFISNETFIGMIKLRKVDLSHNLIRNMDLNVVSSNGILDFNFGSNDLRQVDVTNFMAMNKALCGVSYAYNRSPIHITNVVRFQLGENSSKMCNDIDVSGVTISSLLVIPISQNIESSEMGKYVPCGAHIYKGSASACDCNVAELLPLPFAKMVRFIRKEASEYVCETPETLFNMTIYDVYHSEELQDLMICNIKDYCHSKPNCQCECTSQPSRNRLLVDCSNQFCTDFPDIVPDSKYDVTLIMRNNRIRDIKPKEYFSRVKILDLSENPVQNLDDNTDVLEKASEIRIYNHTIQTLPKTVKRLHPDVFRFEKSGIPCICENVWIGEWRTFKKASKEYPLYCSNYDNILIEDKVLRCDESNAEPYWYIAILILLLTLLLTVMFVYMHFRFDFLIMKRRLSDTKPHTKWEHDLYISANEENEDVRDFILRLLEPFLSKKNIRTYVPFRDSIPGSNLEDTVISNLPKCKYVLIIQSIDMYISPQISAIMRRLEYQLAWDHFIKGQVDRLLVLSFDKTKFDKFQYRKTKAMNRAGMGFIVSTRTKCIKDKLLETFSNPIITDMKNARWASVK